MRHSFRLRGEVTGECAFCGMQFKDSFDGALDISLCEKRLAETVEAHESSCTRNTAVSREAVCSDDGGLCCVLAAEEKVLKSVRDHEASCTANPDSCGACVVDSYNVSLPMLAQYAVANDVDGFVGCLCDMLHGVDRTSFLCRWCRDGGSIVARAFGTSSVRYRICGFGETTVTPYGNMLQIVFAYRDRTEYEAGLESLEVELRKYLQAASELLLHASVRKFGALVKDDEHIERQLLKLKGASDAGSEPPRLKRRC